MDRIIFRKDTNDFMRFTDNEIVIMGEKEEADEQFELEKKDGSNPIILCLNYSKKYFDSEGNYKQLATITENDENGAVVDYLTYSLAAEECFYEAFNEWAKEYIQKQVK